MLEPEHLGLAGLAASCCTLLQPSALAPQQLPQPASQLPVSPRNRADFRPALTGQANRRAPTARGVTTPAAVLGPLRARQVQPVAELLLSERAPGTPSSLQTLLQRRRGLMPGL
eukprot:10995259-Alexandrium_andersonii.AAC.1